MSTLEKAILISVQAHERRKDKAGAPYILHPVRVMLKMHSELEMMAAVLHDVIEDSDWTMEDLQREGFPDAVVEAVGCLTREPEMDYEAFIEQIKANSMARKVKLADLEDNMDIRRLENVTSADMARIRKYHRAWLVLKGA